jgi:hypothetical protein
MIVASMTLRHDPSRPAALQSAWLAFSAAAG